MSQRYTRVQVDGGGGGGETGQAGPAATRLLWVLLCFACLFVGMFLGSASTAPQPVPAQCPPAQLYAQQPWRGGWVHAPRESATYHSRCKYMKARYNCETRPHVQEWRWRFEREQREECSTSRFSPAQVYRREKPIRVLMFGNSLLRELFESISCEFQDLISHRASLVQYSNTSGWRYEEFTRSCHSGRLLRDFWFGADDDLPHYDGYRDCSDNLAEVHFNDGNLRLYFGFHADVDSFFSESVHMAGEKSDVSRSLDFGLSDVDMLVCGPGSCHDMGSERVAPAQASELLANSPHPLPFYPDFRGVFVYMSGVSPANNASSVQRPQTEEEVRRTLWQRPRDKKSLPGSYDYVLDLNEVTRLRSDAHVRNKKYTSADHHMCLPGPHDDLANALLHILWHHTSMSDEDGESHA